MIACTLAALALVSTAEPIQKVDVTGQVTLSSGRQAKWAVVWLEGDEKSQPLKKYVIDQRDRTFIPHVNVVTVGTNVSFPNNDTIYHNVFADFDAKQFNIGYYPHGQTKTKLFDKTGVVYLLCRIHDEMSAFIVIVDTPYYAKADESGNFKISDVPSGRYTLRAWHENREIAKYPVTISPGQASLKIALKRP